MNIQNKYVSKRKIHSINERKGTTNVDFKTPKTLRKKHCCWKRYMETKDGEKYRECCKLRDKVKSLTCKAIRNKEKDIVKDIKFNPKKFWQYTKKRTKTRIGISDLLMNSDSGEDRLTINDQEEADTLSTFFSSVFTKENVDVIPKLKDIVIKRTCHN